MTDSSTGAPQRIGRYEVLRRLGRGGMATVFLAKQDDLDRFVALKEMNARGDDPSYARRFLRESRLAASLSHRNIVTVHDYFEHDGTPYIAMEYVQGGSLRAHIGQLSLAQICGVLEGLLSGLADAERHDIVHRDLKPENLMVTWDGHIKIADFGIAKATKQLQGASFLTATGTTLGTPAYMAPEQAMAQEIGPWTDLYSVGCIAFELFTGRPPFEAGDPMAMLLKHVNEDVPGLHGQVDSALADWVARLVRREPSERYQSAADALDDLEEIVIGLLGPRWRRQARLPTGRSSEAESRPLTPAPLAEVRNSEPKDERRSWGVAPSESRATPMPSTPDAGGALDVEAGAPGPSDGSVTETGAPAEAEANEAATAPTGDGGYETFQDRPLARPPTSDDEAAIDWSPWPDKSPSSPGDRGPAAPDATPADSVPQSLEEVGPPTDESVADRDADARHPVEPTVADRDGPARSEHHAAAPAPRARTDPAPLPPDLGGRPDRFSDSLVALAATAAPKRPPDVPSRAAAGSGPRRRRRGLWAAGIVAGLGGVALLAYEVAPERVEFAPARLETPVRAGDLSVQVPDTWRTGDAAGQAERYGLTDAVAIRAPGAGADELVMVGLSDTTDPSLLSPKLVDAVTNRRVQPQAVRLGPGVGYRYADLRGDDGRPPATVLALPTSAGVATVVCQAASGSDTARACDAVARTLAVDSARVYPPAPRSQLAQSLNAAFDRFADRQSRHVAAARRAKTARGLARELAGIGSAYESLTRTIDRIEPVAPYERAALDGLGRDLGRLSDAYASMSRAASRRQRERYADAQRDARAARQRLLSRLDALRDLGYDMQARGKR